jgi:predicted ABC-type ATPase
MSSPDKVAFLQKAQQVGYRTYLYFVATEDADINVMSEVPRASWWPPCGGRQDP